MKAAAFDYDRPLALRDATAKLAEGAGDAKPMSGGCSLGPMLNLRLARPGLLVDLRGIEELRKVERQPDALRIGACWTHAEIEDGILPDVTRGFMRKVAGGIAYRAVRNRGTIGGSIAHADPAADWITTMLALDARLVVRGADGERRTDIGRLIIAAYTTDLAEDEIIVAIEVPALQDGARWAYHKLARKTGEFAHALGAVVLDPARRFSRVVCGAIEAPPILLERTAAALLQNGAAGAQEIAAGEIEDALAGQGEVFRQIHIVAVRRALDQLSAT